jgi:hypothetical protein
MVDKQRMIDKKKTNKNIITIHLFEKKKRKIKTKIHFIDR